MNTVCKEHEWVGYLDAKGNYCNKCGIKQPPIDYSKLPLIDFHIEENLEVINKLGWEDIFLEFQKQDESFGDTNLSTYVHFFKWVSENFLAPERKNT